MKIRLAVREEDYDRIARELTDRGIELDDASPLVLTQQDGYVSHLAVREPGDEGGRLHIETDRIVTIEAYGHTVEVWTVETVYRTGDRLYQLQAVLDPGLFIRVSNSVIVNRRQIREIRPTFSQKFLLTMKNGRRVDVTRSYYAAFKKAIGI